MTWEQFEKIVEERGISQDARIQFIVVGDLHTDCLSVRFEQGGLSISNERNSPSATTETIGTMTWGQLKGIVEEKMERQDISLDSRVWFIDVLSPHVNEEERVSVELDQEGLWISNI